MIYAQFYQKSAISDETIEACGDRSVIIIDGRLSKFNQMAIATKECSKRGYIAWRLFSGDFLRGTPKTPMFTVFNSEK